MQVDQSAKCAHKPCKCLADGGGDYCSTYCESAAIDAQGESSGSCGCGHPGCETSVDEPVPAMSAY